MDLIFLNHKVHLVLISMTIQIDVIKYTIQQIDMAEQPQEKQLNLPLKVLLALFALVISAFKLIVVYPFRKTTSTISTLWKFANRKLNQTKLWMMSLVTKLNDARVQEQSSTQIDSNFLSLHQEIYMLRERAEQLEKQLMNEREVRKSVENQLYSMFKKFTDQDTTLVKEHKHNIELLVENDMLKQKLKNVKQQLQILSAKNIEVEEGEDDDNM